MSDYTINSKSTLSRGGGYTPLSQAVVAVRLTNYITRNWKRIPTKLTQEQRQIVFYTLTQYFGYTKHQIQLYLAVSRITIWNDEKSANLYYATNADFRQKVKKLHDYIIYYAKYLPSVSQHLR